jgi:hypothetical protein
MTTKKLSKGGTKGKAEGGSKELAARELRRRISSTLTEGPGRIAELVDQILEPADMHSAAAALTDLLDVIGSEEDRPRRLYLAIHAAFAALLHMCNSREQVVEAVRLLRTTGKTRGRTGRKGGAK